MSNEVHITINTEPGAGASSGLIPADQIAEWRGLQEQGMCSAVGEYTPEEFWILLDAYERLVIACREAKRRIEEQAAKIRRLQREAGQQQTPKPPEGESDLERFVRLLPNVSFKSARNEALIVQQLERLKAELAGLAAPAERDAELALDQLTEGCCCPSCEEWKRIKIMQGSPNGADV